MTCGWIGIIIPLLKCTGGGNAIPCGCWWWPTTAIGWIGCCCCWGWGLGWGCGCGCGCGWGA